MRDDEMKKQGIVGNNRSDWGSQRLFCLGFKHPATPSFVPPPRHLFTESWQVEGCFWGFYFSPLATGRWAAGISQIAFVLPNYLKCLLWHLWRAFFYFLGGFLGSPLFLKTPYVVFNSGHMLSAACVVPASVFCSALSAGDDSVACFAVACFAFCSCSNTAFAQIQHLPCSFPLL